MSVYIYVTWYRLYNFHLDGRDEDIINLNYKKKWDILFKNQIIFDDCLKTPFLHHSWCNLGLSLQKLIRQILNCKSYVTQKFIDYTKFDKTSIPRYYENSK